LAEPGGEQPEVWEAAPGASAVPEQARPVEPGAWAPSEEAWVASAEAAVPGASAVPEQARPVEPEAWAPSEEAWVASAEAGPAALPSAAAPGPGVSWGMLQASPPGRAAPSAASGPEEPAWVGQVPSALTVRWGQGAPWAAPRPRVQGAARAYTWGEEHSYHPPREGPLFSHPSASP